jgi:hypothetical protein
LVFVARDKYFKNEILRMNQTIFKDENNNAIRFSQFRKMEAETPFTGLGIKYVGLNDSDNCFILYPYLCF